MYVNEINNTLQIKLKKRLSHILPRLTIETPTTEAKEEKTVE